MEHFCISVESDAQQDELLRAIRGRGAFRCFRDTIYNLDIRDAWYSYRNDALKKSLLIFWIWKRYLIQMTQHRKAEHALK
jgi:hypothetical protein